MKFTAFTQNLLRALAIAERSAGKSLQLPIVGYVLFEIEKNKLKISGTNLEQGVVVNVLGKSEGEAKLAVPARMASEFIRNLKSEKVTLAIAGTLLKIETEANRAAVQGLSADDFPVIPKITEEPLFEIQPAVWAHALESVSIAASRADIRSELQGVFLSWDPRIVEAPFVAAATDSFRLAEFRVTAAELSPKEKNAARTCIVPLKACQETIRIAGETEADLAVLISETQIGLKWEGGEFVSRLLEGSFPNYQSIIPSTFTTEVECKRRELIDLIRQAGLFASKINDVKLQFSAKHRGITVRAKDAAKGEYEGSTEGSISGNDIEVSFNYQFLLEGLERIGAEHVFIGVNDANAPVLLRAAAEEANYRYVVMPLRV